MISALYTAARPGAFTKCDIGIDPDNALGTTVYHLDLEGLFRGKRMRCEPFYKEA
jgi:hypothetical protein